jgi:ribosomal protein L40E
LRHEMSEEERPDTQFEILQKKFKAWLKNFGKNPVAIPVVVALTCGIFYLSVAYLGAFCLSNMIAPLFLLGMLWSIDVKRVRKLLIIGAVTTLIFGTILALFLVDNLQHVKSVDALSEDKTTAVGTLSPLFGGPQTVFTYNLTITLTNDSQTLDNVSVLIFKLGQSGGKEYNYTMTQVNSDSHTETNSTTNVTITTRHYNYTYVSTFTTPINQYLYRVEISGVWMTAGDRGTANRVFYIQGPIYTDTWKVTSPILPSAIQYAYIYVFGPYAIILGMIWWTRRARRMRAQQAEKWEKERAKDEAEKPKVESKVSRVPSLATAMGKDEDTFVCSECGADVPSDATVCPKCGEKFE